MALRVTRAGVGLAVGIILLAAVVFGGLWAAQERGKQARREEAVKIADQKLRNESDKEVSVKTPKDEDTSGSEPNKAASDSDEALPGRGDAQGRGGSRAESSGAQPQPQAQVRAEAVEGTGGATELPQTGSEEAIAPIALGALTFMVVAYLRSRRLLL